MTKHCFVCGRKENENGCTNKDCPRYEVNKKVELTVDKDNPKVEK